MTAIEKFQKMEAKVNSFGLLHVHRNEAPSKVNGEIKEEWQDFILRFLRGCYTTYDKRNKFQGAGLRSLGDIYRLTKNYYPKIELIDVLKLVVTKCKNGTLQSSVCSVVRKRVYCYNYSVRVTIHDQFYGDGYKMTWNDYEEILNQYKK